MKIRTGEMPAVKPQARRPRGYHENARVLAESMVPGQWFIWENPPAQPGVQIHAWKLNVRLAWYQSVDGIVVWCHNGTARRLKR